MNRRVIRFFQRALPWIYQYGLGGFRVEVDEESLNKLKLYWGTRMLLLPNHPTPEDPFVMFDLAKQLGETFYFVAARETFDWEWGFRGWVFQRTGTYSLIRGAVDRESFMMTRKILKTGDHRLVIFIEGEISNENDTVIPFEPGVLQLAYKAQEEAKSEEAKSAQSQQSQEKSCENSQEELEEASIYVAPVAIKYFYAPGIGVAIEKALQRLEIATNLAGKPDQPSDIPGRLRALGQVVLRVQERRLNLKPAEEMTLDERIEAVKLRILSSMEEFLNIEPSHGSSFLHRQRMVRNQMDKLLYAYQDHEELSSYEQRIQNHLEDEFREFYEELERLKNFLTLADGYISRQNTPERIVEVIHRLENEIFGKFKLIHPRTAVVQVGDVHNLRDRFEAYEADKKGMAQQLAQRLEENMLTMLSKARNPYSIVSGGY